MIKTLVIYNLTGSPLSYLSGTVTVAASGNTTVADDSKGSLAIDGQFRSDCLTNIVQISDGIRRFGATDAIKYLDSIPGTTDKDSRGITSTTVVSGVTTHQALDVNITSGTSTGSVDNSTFTYSDTTQQIVGGVYNDTGAGLTSGRAGAVRATQYRALHVNLRDSGGSEKSIFPSIETGVFDYAYNEITSVASSILTTISIYTASQDSRLKLIEVSGSNIADYKILYNASVIAKKRTYFGGSLNESFSFEKGFILLNGDTITVKVIHTRPFVGDFNSNIIVLKG